MTTISEAIREFTEVVGNENADRQWILSNYDSWERNPFYRGVDQPHPEDDSEDY